MLAAPAILDHPDLRSDILGFVGLRDAICGLLPCSRDWLAFFDEPAVFRQLVATWTASNETLRGLLDDPTRLAVLAARPLLWALIGRLGLEEETRERVLNLATKYNPRDRPYPSVVDPQEVAYRCAMRLMNRGLWSPCVRGIAARLVLGIVTSPTCVDFKLDYIAHMHACHRASVDDAALAELRRLADQDPADWQLRGTVDMAERIRSRKRARVAA